MKNVKGWEEEEDDYDLFASPSNKKKHKMQLKGCYTYCGEFGCKAADCPNKKSNQDMGSKGNPTRKRNTVLKVSTREKDIKICLKL